MNKTTPMSLPTTGEATFVPMGKIKPIRSPLRHVVPVEIARVVTDQVPIACHVLKARQRSSIHVYEGRYFRPVLAGGHPIQPQMYDLHAGENPRECPTWRKDAATWEDGVPSLAETAFKRMVDTGWDEAYLKATKAASDMLHYGPGLMHVVPAPSLRVRYNPGANVGSEVVVESVLSAMSTLHLHVRFPLDRMDLALDVAKSLVRRSSGYRPGMPAYQEPKIKVEKFQVNNPSLLPAIGARELGEDIGYALDTLAEHYVSSSFDADAMEAFATVKAMVREGLHDGNVSEAVDLLCASVERLADRDIFHVEYLMRLSKAINVLFRERLAQLDLTREPTP